MNGSSERGRPTKARLRWPVLLVFGVLAGLVLVAGCAKYNTYFNAKRAFDEAEHEREERIKRRDENVAEPTPSQRKNYEDAARKAQKILDEYVGHSLTDDVLFLQAKAYHRIQSYRMSVRKNDLLFSNFPQTPYLEEAIFIQALNYMLVGDVSSSSEYLSQLELAFPESRFQAEALKVQGENAFVLEEWEEAKASFENFRERFPEAADAPEIGFKLARCMWELELYEDAANILPGLAEETENKDLAFDARLLLARVKVKLALYDVVEQMTAELHDQAEIFNAQGDVALIEAESLVAQGKLDDAAPLLENLPEDWDLGSTRYRIADLLGYLYLERWQLEEAQEKFQESQQGRDDLDDIGRTRQMLASLKDYLAAEQSLATVKEERVPSLKLLQANELLFSLGRPRQALDLYLDVAADDHADSTQAARALFGAVKVCREKLALPDSAAIFEDQLLHSYPDSPQAFQIREGDAGDLLAYLLQRQEDIRQQEAELAATEQTGDDATRDPAAFDTPAADAGPDTGDSAEGGLRRRKIYRKKRPDLIFDASPPVTTSATVSQPGTTPAANVAPAFADSTASGEF